jgi:hypothetical protein
MKLIRRGVAIAGDYTKARPKEAFWSMVGTGVGVIAGFSLGGVGIAAGGGASGFSGMVVLIVLAGVGGLLGNRFGIWLDRRTAKN